MRKEVKTEAQRILKIVSKHLLKQNARSQLNAYLCVSCAYRGYGGRKCAIGVLIKDEHYHKLMESCLIQSSDIQRALALSGVRYVSELTPFLKALQLVHDQTHPREWATELKRVARNYRLSVPTAPRRRLPRTMREAVV